MAAADEEDRAMTNLAPRLEDLPGVASVEVDVDDVLEGGINVRLEPGADEADVMERVRALLVAYGIRSEKPDLHFHHVKAAKTAPELNVEVRITPIKGGARIEVIGKKVRSFRVVPPNPAALAQGLADAWCQVEGKIPLEVARVAIEGDVLIVALFDGDSESVGVADIHNGLETALAMAVGRALGIVPTVSTFTEDRELTPTS
jgi:hypothetical protein